MNEEKNEPKDPLDCAPNEVNAPPSEKELIDVSMNKNKVEACNMDEKLVDGLKKIENNVNLADSSKCNVVDKMEVDQSMAEKKSETKETTTAQKNTKNTLGTRNKVETSTNKSKSEKVPNSKIIDKDSSSVSKIKANDVPEQLKKIFNEVSDTILPDKPTQKKDPILSNNSTENLLSVLEDDTDLPSKNTVPEASQSVPENKPPVPVKPPKKYVYKLKAKSGKVLRYTSPIPIVLKRPVITLTKMEEEFKSDFTEKLTENETDEVDSDNSTKENNIKENDASGDTPVRLTRRKGRPPLSQKTPVISVDDRNSSDNTDSKDDFRNKMAPFTMQTRKRQLKFLPDGRVVTPGKKIRSEVNKKNRSDSSSTESDFESDEDSESERKYKKVSSAKKFNPLERKITEKNRKFKKVFDFESYIREKSGILSPAEGQDEAEKSTPTSKKTTEIEKDKSTPFNSSTPISKKITAVDPAQLLSSLIGVAITPSQLNIVKFKPKVIQERTNNSTLLTPKKVTFQEDKLKKPVVTNQTDSLKTTPYKLGSKPLFQKILPKPPVITPKTTPILKKPVENRNMSPATPPKTFTAIAPKIANNVGKEYTPEFKNFTDTRVVKTKQGPKKASKKQYEDGNSSKTIYDLLRNVFEKMPSWNLHVIPDTNSFCIAQVSRGRMGIPILKKSIELNSEFFAKVYVHQLHCKRYDGVYDTESKILTLIREIDSLAA